MVRKSAGAARKSSVNDLRRTGLDVCDAILADLAARGLVAITPEALTRLEEAERTLQSYKLARFSREMAALRFRLGGALRRNEVSAATFAGRLARLHHASRNLREKLNDLTADPREIEDIAGRTWRDNDLEPRENIPLAELAWESVKLEEGFRVDTSYFLAPGGEVFCERKIVPLGLRATIDDSPKPQRPGVGLYPSMGLYPGDLPRRVKIYQPGNILTGEAGRLPSTETESVDRLLREIPESLEMICHSFLNRSRRPFPPETFPAMLARPLLQERKGKWLVVGQDGVVLGVAQPPSIGRQPDLRPVMDSFEQVALSEEFAVLLLLLHRNEGRIAALPAGAITTDRVIRFGLDTV